jgi:hypothetical protein
VDSRPSCSSLSLSLSPSLSLSLSPSLSLSLSPSLSPSPSPSLSDPYRTQRTWLRFVPAAAE